MLDILKWLYAINGFVAVLFFVPQIGRAWNSRSSLESMSLVTLGGWSVSGAITVLYAWFFAHDLTFTAASCGATVGNVTIFGIVAGKRLAYRHVAHEAQVQGQPDQPGRVAPEVHATGACHCRAPAGCAPVPM